MSMTAPLDVKLMNASAGALFLVFAAATLVDIVRGV